MVEYQYEGGRKGIAKCLVHLRMKQIYLAVGDAEETREVAAYAEWTMELRLLEIALHRGSPRVSGATAEPSPSSRFARNLEMEWQT